MFQVDFLVEGRYQVTAKIGQGGMGEVWLALDKRLHRTVVLKTIKKTGTAYSEIAKKTFAMEWSVLKKLRHPGLPIIFDIIDRDDMFILVMDYFQGKTLSQLLQEQGAQPQKLVIEWGIQLCDILEYLHSNTPPIIYRDMKPSNIIQQPNGRLALVDFGSAYEYGSYEGVLLGTKIYVAPEQYVAGSQIDARTDIYALGVTLYHLVTGEVPYISFIEHKTIRQCNPELSADLEQIIERCTQREPSQRFQSAQELKYALTTFQHTEKAHKRKQIFSLLGIWKKEQFGSLSRIAGSEPDVVESHVTEDFDMIRYNAKLLAHLQSERERWEI